SLKNSIRLIPQDGARGKIYDRNGRILADNSLSFDAVIIPQELKNKEKVLKALAERLSMSLESLKNSYERLYLNPFTPIRIATGISKTTAIILEEESFDLKGLHIELTSRRYYPFGNCASHVLGYMGEIDRSRITRLKDYGYAIKDKIGYSGIEEDMDYFLRGEKGGQQIEVDSRGRQVRLMGYRPPKRGKDVQLTIDLELQQLSDKLLDGKKGAIVVLDAKTGGVVVMSSSPGFDPNVFIDRKDKKSLNYYLTSEDAPLFNRAISGQFPPGSVFKPITAMAALKIKKFSPSLTYDCGGAMRIGNRDFKCWSEHGGEDFFQAMGHSCDIYFYRLGLMAGVDMLAQTAHEFGLGSSTGIDLKHEASGFIPSKIWKRMRFMDGWYDGDTANFSIGQGFVLTTPLQLARMMAVFGNGGYLVTPHVTSEVDGEKIDVKPAKKIKVPPEFLKVVGDSLSEPVNLPDGTAAELNVAGLDICAKTGTAQVSGELSHGWVAGFFPKNDAKYSFCILLENSGTSHYACSLGRQLFEQAKAGGKLS
ncbi:MAG TPA: penicillin-binding protein 2, partial [Candidatus Omnitrophota bacterium]|nr:penicillin-binding protein 2 [Candidatus Omnitrophota bacterium]